ncbi:MAG TPA: hypothetical protein VFM09_02355 [Marmoricola sp.]|nr:hypothetical protein [Marmoricola sp.]
MTFPLRPLSLLAALLAAASLVSGCGGSAAKPQATAAARPTKQPSVTLPTGDVSVPPGVKITPPGTKLSFGQTATVAYEPNTKRKTVLQLTVTRVQKARISDLSAYVLDKRARRSTPYYVDVRVHNAGSGDVGHTDVPVWLVDQADTLIHSSGFTNRFSACPSTTLPAKFGPGARVQTCLLYLVPDHGRFTAMSFRPLQAYAPITWTGTVAQPRAHHQKHVAQQKKHHAKHGKKKH